MPVPESVIVKFFDERKEAWLKKNIKASMADNENEEVQQECKRIFSLLEWLPNAAKRAGQISMATHPCTFSHPSARKNKNGYVSSIIANAGAVNDGFLKSGNAAVAVDALGNAAALDVYKFLTLVMDDGQQLIAHIQQETELAKKLLSIDLASYAELRSGFLAMTRVSDEAITSSKIKQIYFPVGSDYHQLSLLTNSGIVYELRHRIDAIRFSEEVKTLRDIKRKEEFSERSFSEIYNLTTIAYGGTKPQNISVLNNQNGGKAHLLQSLPPSIESRLTHFPKTNFFTESLRYYEYRDTFMALHKILKTDYNNIRIREGRNYRLQELMDSIIGKMWAVRGIASKQYYEETSRLKAHQKVWLCAGCEDERETSDNWLDKLLKEISVWVGQSYAKVLGKQAIKLSEAERIKIAQVVENNKEALR